MNFTVDLLTSGFSAHIPDGVIGFSSWALIRSQGKNILFEGGSTTHRNQVRNLLAKHGLTPEDIDMVILSHGHFDHTYNIDYFPQAEFVLTKQEWEYMNDMSEKRDMFIDEKTVFLLRNYKLRLVDDESQEIMPGMSYILTPGHTPGCLTLVLDQGEEGKWVLCADAGKNRAELQTLKVWMTLKPEDSEESLRKIVAAGNRILPGHDSWMRVVDGKVVPEGENVIRIVPHVGVTLNGGNKFVDLVMD